MKTSTLYVRIPDDLMAELRRIAERRGCSLAHLVADLLKQSTTPDRGRTFT